MAFFYILYNAEIDRYYSGSTLNLEKRLYNHNQGNHKVKYTQKQKGLWRLVYKENYDTLSEAVLREKQVKKYKSRKFIENLIEQSRS